MSEGCSCVLPTSSSGDRHILKIPHNALTEEEHSHFLEAVKRVHLGQYEGCEGTLLILVYKLKFAIKGEGAFQKYIVKHDEK